MDEYRTAKQTCPEETILMIGNKDFYIPAETLKSICEEYKNWEEKTFPGVHVLNMALHVDEQGAPHIHERKAWLYIDEQGNEAIGQNKSLQAAGIPLPHPDKPQSRYNNRKQIASQMCRAKFLDICKEHGFSSLLETTPRERSKSGQELIEYQMKQAEEQVKGLNILLNEQRQQIADLNREEGLINLRLQIKKDEYEEIIEQIHAMQIELYQKKEFLQLAEQREAFQEFISKQHERTR